MNLDVSVLDNHRVPEYMLRVVSNQLRMCLCMEGACVCVCVHGCVDNDTSYASLTCDSRNSVLKQI